MGYPHDWIRTAAPGRMFVGRPADGNMSALPLPETVAGLIYTGLTQFDSSTDSKVREAEIRFNPHEAIAHLCVAVVSPGTSSNAEVTRIVTDKVNGTVCRLIVTVQSNDGEAITPGTMCSYTVVMEPK